jgi:hypothetical protein
VCRCYMIIREVEAIMCHGDRRSNVDAHRLVRSSYITLLVDMFGSLLHQMVFVPTILSNK